MEEFVVVIGGANVDLIGTPYKDLVRCDSNPGTLRISSGGVGRNITENLARMGEKVKFISAFGNDANGDALKKELRELCVDVSMSLTKDLEPTSTYLCLNDASGDMAYAFSAMDILKNLNEEFFKPILSEINKAKCVVLDTNLEGILPYLMDNITVPIFLDTVSTRKALICKDAIKNLYLLKPNLVEMEALLGITIDSNEKMLEAVDIFHKERNIQNMVVSMGKDGVYYSSSQEKGYQKSLVKDIVSTTGAGDSFVAALVHGYMQNKTLAECVKLGCAASKITIESAETVSKKMTNEALYECLK